MKLEVSCTATEISTDFCNVKGNINVHAKVGFIVRKDDRFLRYLVTDSTLLFTFQITLEKN